MSSFLFSESRRPLRSYPVSQNMYSGKKGMRLQQHVKFPDSYSMSFDSTSVFENSI